MFVLSRFQTSQAKNNRVCCTTCQKIGTGHLYRLGFGRATNWGTHQSLLNRTHFLSIYLKDMLTNLVR